MVSKFVPADGLAAWRRNLTAEAAEKAQRPQRDMSLYKENYTMVSFPGVRTICRQESVLAGILIFIIIFLYHFIDPGLQYPYADRKKPGEEKLSYKITEGHFPLQFNCF